MTDCAAFLAAIAARPDDDLPRLVFADWLDEHGHPDRAAFVRLQCAGDPDSLRRAAELEARHRAAWLGPLARIVFRAEFRRGFVEHAVLPAAAFLTHAPDLRRHTPLRGVTLLGARRVLPELVRGPHLAGLSALHLTGGRLGDDGLRLLISCPALADLTTLRLGDNSLTDAGVMAIACNAILKGLTTLVLRDNLIGDGGAWALAHTPCLGRLAALDLSGNEIGPAGVEALRSSPRLPALMDLDVTDQRPPAGRRPRALAAAK